ncbi:MAG TPA: hypothetical protein DCS05_05950, partial [Nitrospiraceae bacterium]|nr:hypothetical protein [Nitrospiraceae bacterium]
MIKFHSNNSAVFFAAMLLLLPACIPQKKEVVELTLRESEQDIRKGDFDGALGVYGAALRKCPGDRGLLKYFLEA